MDDKLVPCPFGCDRPVQPAFANLMVAETEDMPPQHCWTIFHECGVTKTTLVVEADTEAAAIAAWNRRSGWRPIEEAPRDGTAIFGCNYEMGHRGMVSFNGHEWEMVNGLTNMPMGIGFYPTHWQPLPTPPEATNG